MLELFSTDDFNEWVGSLRDAVARARVLKQIQRIQVAGRYVGDWKPVGGGVIEIRLMFGSGHRLYTAIRGGELLLLLAGGDKSTQERDILKAQSLLAEWDRSAKGNGEEDGI